MDMFSIWGGTPLQGTVAISGAKNAALPLMAACIAVDGPVRLRRVPDLADITTLSHLLFSLGLRVERDAAGTLTLETVDASACVAPDDLVRSMRAGICVLGPLLARRGRARIALPGGCNIGDRPVDLHLKGLMALGACIRIENGDVIAEAARLKGAAIDLAGPRGTTVTGTCNVMTAAALARGTTTLSSAALEPEVVELGRFLNSLGGRIRGLGTSQLQIEGVESLRPGEYSVIPDRIEAATLMMAAATTGGHVRLAGTRADHLDAVIRLLRTTGVEVDVFAQTDGRSQIEVERRGPLKPVSCTARPYPGIPTDVQAPLTSLLTQAHGESVVTDAVFPSRFMHLAELARLGANVRQEGDHAIVRGGSRLRGADMTALDLRAGAGLIIGALAAEGRSTVCRIDHLDRGYERFEHKLQMLGADVHRVLDAGDQISAHAAESLRELPPAAWAA